MFGLFRKGSLLEDRLTTWQFDSFEWLLEYTGGIEAFRQRQLILPTRQCFPHDGSRGHAFAEMLFRQVKAHAGMSDWPCELQPQEADPDTMVSPHAFVQGAPASPAGTYRALKEGGALITYNPAQLHNPMSLVATFAHELAHYRTAGFAQPPPGGWDVWEPATDLAAVFFGFGVFLANACFDFQHFSDGYTSGWRWRQQGYLTDVEVLYALALFTVLRGDDPKLVQNHLKSALRGIYRRALREVTANEAALRRLRDVVPVTAGQADYIGDGNAAA